jgi:hypothetical protein
VSTLRAFPKKYACRDVTLFSSVRHVKEIWFMLAKIADTLRVLCGRGKPLLL